MTYDADGNLLTLQANVPGATSLSGSTTYGYDNLDELTSESSTRNGGYSNAFHYDAGQNPITFRNATIPTANVDNQIPRTGTTYDGEGNPATYNSTALTFDPEDRLVSYGIAETNAYTYGGLRASKTTSSGTTFFLYSGIIPVCEINSSGTVTATNTVGVAGLVSRNASSTSTFYAFDPQASTCQRLSSIGSIVSNGITDAFGATIGSTSSDPYSGYNAKYGYYNDPETGLQLLGHRFYDQATGRFINRDPIGYDGGINVYAYCGNRVGMFSDPLGFGAVPPQWYATRPPLFDPGFNFDFTPGDIRSIGGQINQIGQDEQNAGQQIAVGGVLGGFGPTSPVPGIPYPAPYRYPFGIPGPTPGGVPPWTRPWNPKPTGGRIAGGAAAVGGGMYIGGSIARGVACILKYEAGSGNSW